MYRVCCLCLAACLCWVAPAIARPAASDVLQQIIDMTQPNKLWALKKISVEDNVTSYALHDNVMLLLTTEQSSKNVTEAIFVVSPNPAITEQQARLKTFVGEAMLVIDAALALAGAGGDAQLQQKAYKAIGPLNAKLVQAANTKQSLTVKDTILTGLFNDKAWYILGVYFK